MKDVSIAEVFCEILGGLLVILFALPWFAADPSMSFVGLYRSLYVGIVANALAAALVAAYPIGLLMDALGLIADEVITPRLGIAEAILWYAMTTLYGLYNDVTKSMTG